MQDNAPSAIRRVLTFADLKSRKGIPYSRSHMNRKVKDGTFPKPFKLPDSSLNLWFDDVIDDFLTACAEKREWRSNGNGD
jgi:predicted DNA-binding transcriptional regulator AlpA